jgi:hypothetical protein
MCSLHQRPRESRVFDTQYFADYREFGVFSADLFTIGPQVTGLTPADFEVGPDQGYYFTLGFASNDYELHFHENRPDLDGLQR